jgi:hypothetical protein
MVGGVRLRLTLVHVHFCAGEERLLVNVGCFVALRINARLSNKLAMIDDRVNAES